MSTKWINRCLHDSQFYIGWVQCDTTLYDVYVYPARGTHDVCARYGNEPEAYISMGTIGDAFCLSSISKDYKKICRFLLQHGSLQYCRL